VLLRELVGGDPPYTCKLVFRDDPAGFGYRVTDGGQVTEHVLTRTEEFEQAFAAKVAEGFAETERSLTRRVFVTADRFWIVALDAHTLRTQFGGRGLNWRESSGQTRDKEFRDCDRAVAAYHRAIADKQAEGYRELYARTVVIAETPKTLKKPGKRKSR
jgi:predicted DNA-binding WGR domain protein